MPKTNKDHSRYRHHAYLLKTPVKKDQSLNTQSSSPNSANTTLDTTTDSSICSISPYNFGKSRLLPAVNPKKKRERQLESEIRKAELKRDTLIKAIKYKQNKEAEKINNLIIKWKNVAEMASNYLFNQFQLKISGQGGYKEWKNSIRQFGETRGSTEAQATLERLERYMETPEYTYLSDFEKRDIAFRYDELEELIEKEDSVEESDSENSFTMSEMYKYLKIDYDLVFGSWFEEIQKSVTKEKKK